MGGKIPDKSIGQPQLIVDSYRSLVVRRYSFASTLALKLSGFALNFVILSVVDASASETVAEHRIHSQAGSLPVGSTSWRYWPSVPTKKRSNGVEVRSSTMVSICQTMPPLQTPAVESGVRRSPE